MRKLLLVVVCGIVLGVAAPAMASPTSGAYSGTGANQLSQVQSAAASQSPTSSSDSSGTLPFTGLNLGLLGGVAIALMGSGLVLRRRTRSTS